MIDILGKATSINVRKVLWTCAELDIPYRQEDWGAGYQSTNTPDFRELNPNALVPVIRDGDFVMWESNAIVRYLANRYGQNCLYPADSCLRARVDQWIDWQSADLNPSWSYAFMALVRRSPQHQDAAQVARSVDRWNALMVILDRELSTRAYVAADRFTLADVPIGLSVHRWLTAPIERPVLPAALAYHQRLRARPGFLLHGDNGTP